MSDDPSVPFPPSPSIDPIAPPPTPVTTVVRPARASRGGTALNGLLVVASLVAVGGIAFGIGRATAATPAASTAGRFGAGAGQTGAGNGQAGVTPGGSFAPGRGAFGGQGGFGGFGASLALQGTVVAVTPDTLTLQTTGGQTVQVPLASSTTYGRDTASDATAVTKGAQVVVQLPGGRVGFGNGGQGRGGSQAPGASAAPGASSAPGASAAPSGGSGLTLGPAVSVTVLP